MKKNSIFKDNSVFITHFGVCPNCGTSNSVKYKIFPITDDASIGPIVLECWKCSKKFWLGGGDREACNGNMKDKDIVHMKGTLGFVNDPECVRVGAAAFIVRGDQFIIGKRKGSFGEGQWSLPGGKPDMYESPEKAVVREAYEETGIRIKSPVSLGHSDEMWKEKGIHFVTLFFLAKMEDERQEPKIMEPEKCYKWDWANLQDFTRKPFPKKFSPLFACLGKVVKQKCECILALKELTK